MANSEPTLCRLIIIAAVKNHVSIGKNEEKNEREFEREKVPILRNDHIMALTYVAYRLARLKVMKGINMISLEREEMTLRRR